MWYDNNDEKITDKRFTIVTRDTFACMKQIVTPAYKELFISIYEE